MSQATISVQDIAKLLQLLDKNLGKQVDIPDPVRKKYKNSIKQQREAIEEMVENVTTKRDYQNAAARLANTIKDVQKDTKQHKARGDAEPDYPKPKLCKAKGLKDSKVKAKIESIWHSGPGYKGTKGPKSLGNQVLHAHVTDKDAIAFYWVRNQMHVVGHGKKSGQAGKDDSGYKWDT